MVPAKLPATLATFDLYHRQLGPANRQINFS